MAVAIKELRILIIEDVPADVLLMSHELKKAGLSFRSVRVETRDELLRELDDPPDLILSDHGLPQFDGFTALALAKTICPDVPFIFVTGSIGEESAVETLKSGATDCVLKEHIRNLGPAVSRALRLAEEYRRRREAEQALRDSEERFRLLVAGVKDYAIMMLDPIGKVSSWNAGAEGIFGHSEKEIVGQHFTKVFPKEARVRGRVDASLRTAAEEGRHEEEVWRVRRNGDRFLANVITTALRDEHDKLRGFAMVTRDITALKQAEAEVQRFNTMLEERVAERTAQLESANKDLESFSYSVSHDLRAPLRHIQGFIEILDQHSRDRLDAEDRQLIDYINRSVSRMGLLIDDLLAFAKLGLAELRKVRFPLAKVVRAAISDLDPKAREGATWVIGELPEVDADPVLLRQVMENLISNALKYSSGRSDPRIEISARRTPKEVIVRIRDNGVGFNMEYYAKLFNVFQRLHRASDFEGTGIGLANVRRVVQRHGGRTWAEGKVGAGATFYFSLPVSPQRKGST